MPEATPISLKSAFSRLKILADRTPETTDEEARDAFASLSDYRDGVACSSVITQVIASGSGM